jgi:hypothetical protein
MGKIEGSIKSHKSDNMNIPGTYNQNTQKYKSHQQQKNMNNTVVIPQEVLRQASRAGEQLIWVTGCLLPKSELVFICC